MTAEAAKGHVGITEDVNQSIGYLLYTATAPVYNRETGQIEDVTLNTVIPGITIRPAFTTLRDLPTIDLRDDSTLAPYLTWFQRGPVPVEQILFGGQNRELGYWEINIKLGEQDLLTYQRVQDWVASMLGAVGEMNVYFWYEISGGTPSVSRGDDVIALGRIENVSVVPRVDVAEVRGEDSWITVNFTVGVWKEPL